jgi:putative DNA primase/helicase
MTEPIKASAVRAEAPSWLWQGRIPRGMLTILAGKPDQGKGLVCALMAAEVSRMRIKEGRRKARWGQVLYSPIEDSHALMTRPRLEAAGANLDNVDLWRFTMPAMQKELEYRLTTERYDLLIIDPLAAHLSGGVSRHSDTIRKVLNPLSELIEETQTAVVIVEHVLKRVPQSGHPLAAIGGSSSGVIAAARMAFLLGVDPDDGERRLLCAVKNNICEKPRELAFNIDVAEIERAGDVPHLLLDGEVDFDPMRMLQTDRNGRVGRPPDKRAAAIEWLTNFLYSQGGPILAGKVIEASKHFGMTTKVLRAAKRELEVVVNPPGGGRTATWELPPEVKGLLDEANGVTAELPPGDMVFSEEELEAFLGEAEGGAESDG